MESGPRTDEYDFAGIMCHDANPGLVNSDLDLVCDSCIDEQKPNI